MPITEAEMTAARDIWGAGLVAISKADKESGIDAARDTAKKFLTEVYGFDLGPVLFKPTLASGDQTFRPTFEGALAYYIGEEPAYPNDQGFGRLGWVKWEHTTATSFIDGDIALWAGGFKLFNAEGAMTQVDKSFGYKKDEDGVLRIVLHHSSLPYQP